MMKLNGGILVPCAIGMSLVSPFIMRLYGNAYHQAWPTLVAVLWTAAILGVLTPVGDVIAATGRMWIGLFMNTCWAGIYVLSTFLFVHWGSFGLASSRLIAYAIHAVWTVAFAYVVIRSHERHERQPV
jgi:O-antigen/teichoic acid export membrane protein